jgi:Fe-S cluster assembly iron-binding protein IscA
MIEISETAARKIRRLMAKQGIDEGGLRVGVKGGGCNNPNAKSTCGCGSSFGA